MFGAVARLRQAVRQASSPSGKLAADRALKAYFAKLPAGRRGVADRLFTTPYADAGTTSEALQREVLREGQVLLDYLLLPGRVLVNAVSKGDRRQWVIAIDAPMSDALLAIQQPTRMSIAERHRHEEALAARLLSPLTTWLKEGLTNHLIVSQGAGLSEVPFERLAELVVTEFTPGAPPLVTFAHGASTLAASTALYRSGRPVTSEAGLFCATTGVNTNGGRLTALPELDSYLEELTERRLPEAQTYPDAAVATVVDQLSNYRLLYLAAHGRSAAKGVERNYLQFQPGPQDEGRLYPSDLYALQLNANLSFALNCRSAQGAVLDREGRRSVARALRYAGSTAVIAADGLLKERALTELLRYFHRAWIDEGHSAAEALGLAKARFKAANPSVPADQYSGLVYYGYPDVYYQPGAGQGPPAAAVNYTED